MKFVFIGLSITSSWGNGHATTYRSLIRALSSRGHEVLFLEQDVPYYASNRDLPKPDFCSVKLYSGLDDLKKHHLADVRQADTVIVGSYVNQGVDVGWWTVKTAEGITAFYDIDTPVTLSKLDRCDFEYLEPELIPHFDLYLSFAGGPTLKVLEQRFGSPAARELYCSVDPDMYFPENHPKSWELGYLGTYSPDRQPLLERLLCEPARRMPSAKFVVAGPKYPDHITWPENVQRIHHLPPSTHRKFYNSQKYALNVTREDMARAGYSPSVRLFEAAACGIPIISDHWDGIETIFEPGNEILISGSTEESIHYLNDFTEEERNQIGENARKKTLAHHSSLSRAIQMEKYIADVITA